MAECKTMVRRKSRDALFQPTCSTSGKMTGQGVGANSNGCGCGQASSRSKSYHYHHHHTHQPYQYGAHYQQQNPNYQYYGHPSGQYTPPGLPPAGMMTPTGPNPSVFLYPHQNSQPPLQGPGTYIHPSLSSGALDSLSHQQPHFQQLPPVLPPQALGSQEPPPRSWNPLGYSKHKRTCFTILCYNILCSRYATKSLYSYCPSWALDWNYRRKAILQELVHYGADIISLQEMETDQFYNFFLPQLQQFGYSGIFGAKTRAKTMIESKRKLVDGCAIFYRTNKFRLLSEHLIEFSQLAITNATRNAGHCSEEMLNRVQTKDNIALAALFETKLDSEQAGGLHGLVAPRPRPLLVCTCHIHWDPDYCDVKLVQTMMLMQELRKITDKIGVSDESNKSQQHQVQTTEKRTDSSSSTTSSSSSTTSSTTSTSSLDKVNLIVCGDFNSLPLSGVVEFIQTGSISSNHPDFKGLSYETYMKSYPSSPRKLCDPDPHKAPEPPPVVAADEEVEFEHDFSLKSAYPADTMPFTNYTLDFQGVIDYIFHSMKGLRPLGFLGPFDSSWLVQHNIVGAPHPYIPSDHFPLLVELEMIPAI